MVGWVWAKVVILLVNIAGFLAAVKEYCYEAHRAGTKEHRRLSEKLLTKGFYYD